MMASERHGLQRQTSVRARLEACCLDRLDSFAGQFCALRIVNAPRLAPGLGLLQGSRDLSPANTESCTLQ